MPRNNHPTRRVPHRYGEPPYARHHRRLAAARDTQHKVIAWATNYGVDFSTTDGNSTWCFSDDCGRNAVWVPFHARYQTRNPDGTGDIQHVHDTVTLLRLLRAFFSHPLVVTDNPELTEEEVR